MKTFEELSLGVDDEHRLSEACFDWSQPGTTAATQLRADFLALYFEQLRQLDLQYGKAGEEWIFASKSHRQIYETISTLRDLGVHVTRVEARKAVQDHFLLLTPDPRTLDSLIDAALRIWLLINYRCPDDISVGFGRPCVTWSENDTLSSTVCSIFRSSKTQLTLAQRRLSPSFTLANMINICRLRVRWTLTLDDHLRLDRQHKILWIFPERAWLQVQSKSQAPQIGTISPGAPDRIASAPLDVSIYEEASRTLDLLFPPWDPKTQRFLKQQRRENILAYAQPRELDLKHYSIWRDRLLELNEDIFLAPPEGWVQLWNDRRDPQKFWTFWIALIIFFLTMVSTVATVLQTWATLRDG